MNLNDHDKVFRLSQVPQQLEVSRHNSQLLHELKAYQVSLENENEDLRQMVTTLRQIAKRYSDHYELAPTGMLTISSRGLIKDINQRAAGYLQVVRSRILGTAFTDYLFEEDIPGFIQHLHTALLGVDPVSYELKIRTPSGAVFEGELVSTGWRNEADGSLVIRSSLHNISRRKKSENELRQAYEKAENMSLVKTQFLANMSHEMRTPLGVIIGYTDLLMDEPTKADQVEGIKTIHRNSMHLLNLIDDLLDLAKIEAGKMTLEIQPLSIEEEMQAIVGQFKRRAESKGLRLNLNFLNPPPREVRTDPIRFRQIVLNLLSNALKFTDAGSIDVTVSYGCAKDGTAGAINPNKAMLCLDVTDSGCGIPPEQQNNLFEPFAQAHSSSTRNVGGTGLGLCLSRKFAEALGGTVVLLKSEQQRGSTFRVLIDPFVDQPSDKAGETVKVEECHEPFRELSSLKGIRVLVVEDGLDNQLLIRKLLESVGAEVETAEDGEEAIDCALRDDFDVVLMDIQLPLVDGYEATRRLRHQGCHTPIIALTAHALVEDRKKAEAVGFDDFISKPIDWPKLTKAIVRCSDKYYH